MVAVATGLAFVVAAANAQYYPSGPNYPPPPGPAAYPPGPAVRLGPPMPVEQADDADLYAPPPPPNYVPRPPQPLYPGQAQQPYPQPYPPGQMQAAPAPAPGTNFPPPADYPWTRQRGGYPAPVATAPPGSPYEQAPDPNAPRPPGDVNTGAYGNAGSYGNPGSYGNAGPNGAPAGAGTAVAALPPDIQPEEGAPAQLPARFQRQVVEYPSTEPPGTIIIDTPNTYMYLTLGNGRAMRYGIGVGREGFTWSGTERISKMSEWPDWHPPKEMIERQPYLPRFMAGGPSNPLGARALYLGNTLYRIHGTNQPSTIGSFVSSGCIRLVNGDIEDLYSRVKVGTRVVVLPGANQPPVSAQGAPATAVR
jgi:lipoprotein-anchoring transpeptidase ErfK/SrfK